MIICDAASLRLDHIHDRDYVYSQWIWEKIQASLLANPETVHTCRRHISILSIECTPLSTHRLIGKKQKFYWFKVFENILRLNIRRPLSYTWMKHRKPKRIQGIRSGYSLTETQGAATLCVPATSFINKIKLVSSIFPNNNSFHENQLRKTWYPTSVF